MFENFPYTDMHQLNLDWIIKIAKDFLDQYTHLQQLISDGEASLQNLTDEGVRTLVTKTDELETLLNEWYETHSADIADQLADALQDLNDWYAEHIQSINTALGNAISSFDSHAALKAAETIATIPDDYTLVANGVANLQKTKFYYPTPYGKTKAFDFDDMPYIEGKRMTGTNGTIIDDSNCRMIMIPTAGLKRFSIEVGADMLTLQDWFVYIIRPDGSVFDREMKGDLIPSTLVGQDLSFYWNRLGVEEGTVLVYNDIYNNASYTHFPTECELEYFTAEEWLKSIPLMDSVSKDCNIYMAALHKYADGYMDTNGTVNPSTLFPFAVMDFTPDIIDEISVNIPSGYQHMLGLPIAIIKDVSGTVKQILNPAAPGVTKLTVDHNITHGGTVYINFGDSTGVYRLSQTTGASPYDAYIPDMFSVKWHVIPEVEYLIPTYIKRPFDFQGKTAAFIGTSLTEGVINTNPIVYTQNTWAKLFADWQNMTYQNLAEAGACYYDGSNPSKSSILEQLQNVTGTPDYIFIEGGTNDYLLGTSEDHLRTAVVDVTTYLKSHFSTSQVIFITPINISHWSGPPADNHAMTMDRVREIITESVIYADVGRFSVVQGDTFGFPKNYKDATFTDHVTADGVHPTEYGYLAVYLTGVRTAIC